MTEQITVQPVGNFKINPVYMEEGANVGQLPNSTPDDNPDPEFS